MELRWTTQTLLGPGLAQFETSLARIDGVPSGFFVFEESLRVVAAPPWIAGVIARDLFSFGRSNALTAGAASEIYYVPERDALHLRAGVEGTLQIYEE